MSRSTPFHIIGFIPMALAACGSEDRLEIKSVCDPSDLLIVNGAKIGCDPVAPRISQLAHEKPCRAEVQLGGSALLGPEQRTIEFDEHGNSMQGTFRYTYHADGQVAEAALTEFDDDFVSYFYEDGRVTHGEFRDVRVDFIFDGDRLIEERADLDRHEYEYDDEGRLSKQRLKVLGVEGHVRESSFAYDELGRLETIRLDRSAGEPQIYRFSYDTNDQLGRIEFIGQVANALDLRSAAVREYTYEEGRLATENVDWEGDGKVESSSRYIYCDRDAPPVESAVPL